MKNKVQSLLSKVPEISIVFWLIKILGTTVGETAADYLSVNLNLGLNGTSIIIGCCLLVVLFFQIRAKLYIPWVYWLTVVLISIVGTLITDNLVENLGVSLKMTTLLFATGLIITFFLWFYNEKTLSIHSIYTVKRELFYWAAILFTFAFGTSAGDLLSEGLNLGYVYASFIFISTIAIIYVAYYFFKLNGILSFWLAYILTRPLGASLGDLLTQAKTDGGLAISGSIINIIFLITIVILVIFLTMQQNKVQTKNN